jgi:hypothetical protein
LTWVTSYSRGKKRVGRNPVRAYRHVSLIHYLKKEVLLTTTKNPNVVDFEQESEAFLINKRLLDNSNTTE